MKDHWRMVVILGAMAAGFPALCAHLAQAVGGAAPSPNTGLKENNHSMELNTAGPSAQESNPLLGAWKTPFGMPPFDRIKEDHYLPAFQEAIARTRQEVNAIVKDGQPPTFANTIQALDASGELLDKVEGVFQNLRSAETNDRLQAIAATGGAAHLRPGG